MTTGMRHNMATPFIVAGGKAAAGAAAQQATAKAAQIALTEKAAKATAGAFKSLEETTKMGGFQSLENFSENVKQMQPVTDAWGVLSAIWTGGTAAANTELLISLINLIQSDGFMSALTTLMEATSDILRFVSKLVDFTADLGNEVDKLDPDKMRQTISEIRRLEELENWVDPGRQTSGMQEFG